MCRTNDLTNMKKWMLALTCVSVLNACGHVEKYTLPKNIKKSIRHNMRVKLIREEREDVNHSTDRMTVFLHGYGDNGNRIIHLTKDLLAGNVLIFNFSDSYWNYFNSHLGQMGDVLTALAVIKYVAIDQLNVRIIDLHGMSRGGAVLINMLSVLNNPDQYAQELSLIGLHAADCKDILSRIRPGSHVLHVPLKSADLIVPFMPNKFVQSALDTLSKFDKNGLNPLSEIAYIPENLTMLVHFQKEDKVVGNIGDDIYFEKLAQKSPHSTYVCIGKDGGHIASSFYNYTSLLHTIHYYKKQCGGAYNIKFTQGSPQHLVCADKIDNIQEFFKQVYQ